MKRILSTALLLAGLNGCWTSMSLAQQAKSFDLSASRQPSNGETIELQIVTGPLPPGAKVVAMTAQGQALGAIVPYALPGRDKGSTVTIAVPPTALVDQHLHLQLQLVEPGKPPRAPDKDEVRGVNLVLSPGP
ncbi:hypothetical protein JQ615_10290 [Bradyrhizobium jicamae]|uniref:Lipoprotein n=1 Tax=Bradyrhizobium jicamae TaxID=280332 RepID=A0ABS5FG74_9BRAD|nr:hypothetical protein [Bradyrhizobium jicamae]MBR0795778.1 hypothetical protein [Bradyrhizobium jicamae]MBR0933800.1 hypothetical protein [Bradyrhizobium jicamae]